jgi:hypothetical protein
MAKFKRARKVIHGWQRSLPNLAKLIDKVELIIQLMDFIEENRDLTIQEWKFKDVLVHHLQVLLSNRLQLVITKLVHQNQYGFLKARTIRDCLAWAFEYISICHKTSKELVILKLDFEKAFDKLEHAAIIDILRHKGFGDRWLHWISLILGSGTSQVLLNGVPGRRFHCRRGVRQGDPLSPLLFVLAADLLQSIINKAKDCGILKLPIPFSCGFDFPIIQYADDTIMILEACPRQLFFLKAMLNSFADSTGLHVNYNKSNIYPINVSEQKMAVLANTFHCKVGSLPFTYLGLPLGLRKPNLEAFLPLIQKIERRLASTSIFLSQAGRIQMVNALFSSLPTYYMCTPKLPKTVIKQIDKLRRHCLWRGADINTKNLLKLIGSQSASQKIRGALKSSILSFRIKRSL